ncbi:MAG: hypothetical protein V1897_19835 [Pseudomonadota bacterium]
MKVARVFPTKTNMSPTDEHAYFDVPGLFTPKYDEVHISTTFTWDIPKAKYLAEAWREHGEVRVGGPAFGDPGGEFMPRMYLKPGVTITSRGCPNKCGFCFVPKREGEIRTLKIKTGNIIQDNNLLACPKDHIFNVFEMLKSQTAIEFQGGLDVDYITEEIAQALSELKIKQLFLAYDYGRLRRRSLVNAVDKLSRHFSRDKIRCFVLIGYGDDTLEKAEVRLKDAWEIGTLPFAMLFKDENKTEHYWEWRQLQRRWSRPAITKSLAGVSSS